VGNVSLLGHVDFNQPNARCKERCEELCNGICSINGYNNPDPNATIVVMPDLPKASSLRGLYDEEKQIQENLFANKQYCDTRWVELYDRGPKSDGKTNARRFGTGRVVVGHDAIDTNSWISESELAVAGRPLNENIQSTISRLPRGQELLVPEASSADADIRIADRLRPSPEQVSAQKGVGRLEILWESAVTNMKLPGPLVIVNLTGHVEEGGAADAYLTS
jgi:hypothetical protein